MSHISHVIVLCSFLTTFFPVFYFTACFHPPSNEGARKEGTVTDSLSSAGRSINEQDVIQHDICDQMDL